jgi:hypothetical protein
MRALLLRWRSHSLRARWRLRRRLLWRRRLWRRRLWSLRQMNARAELITRATEPIPSGSIRLRAGPLKQLHIDKTRMGLRLPDVIVIRVGENSYHCSTAWIREESAFRYEPTDPLPPNGTYAWIETYGEVLYWP